MSAVVLPQGDLSGPPEGLEAWSLQTPCSLPPHQEQIWDLEQNAQVEQLFF